jgi:AcrR family transcriptional regulator
MTTTGSPRRSDATRAAILDAARERFAADGYERATIRAIAADAAIDPAMVMRYFGNKEKLFAAAADFDLRIPDLTAVPPSQLGTALVGVFFDRWESDDTLKALLRAAASYEVAAERAREVFAAQVGPIALKVGPDPAQAPHRAGLVATQMIGLAMCRYVLRLPPVVAMDRAQVVAWLGPTVGRYLTAPNP